MGKRQRECERERERELSRARELQTPPPKSTEAALGRSLGSEGSWGGATARVSMGAFHSIRFQRE